MSGLQRVDTLPRVALTEQEIGAIRELLAREPHLRWAYLFGSAARGEGHRDIDVAVMPDPGSAEAGTLGMVELGRIAGDLETLTGTSIDLVDLTSAPLPLAGPMLHERIVLLDRDKDARHCWEAETTSRWIDFRPAYERYSAVRLAAFLRRTKGAG